MNQIYLSWVQYNVTRIQNARVLDGQFEGGKERRHPWTGIEYAKQSSRFSIDIKRITESRSNQFTGKRIIGIDGYLVFFLYQQQ